MRLTLLALLVAGCADETFLACRQTAVDVCMHRLGCHEVDDAVACVSSEVAACGRAPAAALACDRAVLEQDCDALHAHAVPPACMP